MKLLYVLSRLEEATDELIALGEVESGRRFLSEVLSMVESSRETAIFAKLETPKDLPARLSLQSVTEYGDWFANHRREVIDAWSKAAERLREKLAALDKTAIAHPQNRTPSPI